MNLFKNSKRVTLAGFAVVAITGAFLFPGQSFAASGQDWAVDDSVGANWISVLPSSGVYTFGGGSSSAFFGKRSLADGSLQFQRVPFTVSTYGTSCGSFTCLVTAKIDAVRADTSGIYVVGQIYGGSPTYVIAQKYDSAGNLIWSKTISGWSRQLNMYLNDVGPSGAGLTNSRFWVLITAPSNSQGTANTVQVLSFDKNNGSYYSQRQWGVSTDSYVFARSGMAGSYLYAFDASTLHKTTDANTAVWDVYQAALHSYLANISSNMSFSLLPALNFNTFANSSTLLVTNANPLNGQTSCGNCFAETVNLSSGAPTTVTPLPGTISIDDSSIYTVSYANSMAYVKKIDINNYSKTISTTSFSSPGVSIQYLGTQPMYTITSAVADGGTLYTMGVHNNGSWTPPGHVMHIGFLSAVSPTSAGKQGGTSITITGTNLLGTTAVNFNGTPATSFTVNSPTQITAVVPAFSTTGQVSLNVVNPTDTKTISFTYTNAASCTNNATNPTACDLCPANYGWDTASAACVACSNGGCTGSGAGQSNPTGNLVCNNGATNPLACDVFTPTVSLSSSASTINAGDSATLTWGSTHATSCSGTGFSTGGGATSGSTTVSPAQTSSYQVACTGAGGTKTATITITVKNPNITLSVQPPRVRAGGSVTLTWQGTNVAPNSCYVSGTDGFSQTGNSGSSVLDPNAVTSPVTYTATCSKTNGGTISASSTVTIVPKFNQY